MSNYSICYVISAVEPKHQSSQQQGMPTLKPPESTGNQTSISMVYQEPNTPPESSPIYENVY